MGIHWVFWGARAGRDGIKFAGEEEAQRANARGGCGAEDSRARDNPKGICLYPAGTHTHAHTPSNRAVSIAEGLVPRAVGRGVTHIWSMRSGASRGANARHERLLAAAGTDQRMRREP